MSPQRNLMLQFPRRKEYDRRYGMIRYQIPNVRSMNRGIQGWKLEIGNIQDSDQTESPGLAFALNTLQTESSGLAFALNTVAKDYVSLSSYATPSLYARSTVL